MTLILNRLGHLAAVALGFSIPISTAADNVLLAVLLVCFLAGGAYRQKFSFIGANPVLIAALALFGLLVLGACFGPARPKEALDYLLKYADLACIPAIAVFFRDPAARRHGLYAFSAAVVLSALSSYALFAGLPRFPIFVSDPLLAVPYKHSITHSLLLGFASFLFVQFAGAATSPTARRTWFVLAALVFANILIVIPGRTAHVVAAALAVYWAYTRWHWSGLWKLAVAAVMVFTLTYSTSRLFHDRVHAVLSEYSASNPGTPASVQSSVGLRLEFYRNSLQIIREHPLTGVGTGGFPRAYAEQVKGTGMYTTLNPHNEYLLIAAQVGLGGVLVLLYLFYLQWRAAPRLATPLECHVARGLVLTMAIGCLFNSLLLDHAEGLLYAWLTALLYGGLESSPGNRAAPASA